MSQKSTIAAFDAALHIALASAGLADDGTYTPPGAGATPQAVRVYVDKSQREFGEYAQSYAAETTVTLLRADVPDPVEGATVTIDGETFTLRTPLDSDDGISMWGVV